MGGVTNAISHAVGTDGSHGGVLGALAKVDPGPSIGHALAEVDKGVNKAIPGGWITVGALAAGGLAIAYAPEIMALAAESGVAPATVSAELGVPGVVAEGTAAGTPVMGSTASQLGSLGWTAPEIGGGTASSGFGLTGASTGGIGLTGELPANAVLGTGLNGGAIGSTYMAAAPGQIALDAYGSAVPYSSTGIGGFAPTDSISMSDALRTANNARNLANKVLGGATSGKPTKQQFAQFQAANAPTVQAQTPYVNMNQNAFASQPAVTVADMDKINKNDPNAPNFGISNMLKEWNNYG